MYRWSSCTLNRIYTSPTRFVLSVHQCLIVSCFNVMYFPHLHVFARVYELNGILFHTFIFSYWHIDLSTTHPTYVTRRLGLVTLFCLGLVIGISSELSIWFGHNVSKVPHTTLRPKSENNDNKTTNNYVWTWFV